MQAYKVEAGEPAQLMSSYDGLLASDCAYVVHAPDEGKVYLWTGEAVIKKTRQRAAKQASDLLESVQPRPELAREQEGQESAEFKQLWANMEHGPVTSAPQAGEQQNGLQKDGPRQADLDLSRRGADGSEGEPAPSVPSPASPSPTKAVAAVTPAVESAGTAKQGASPGKEQQEPATEASKAGNTTAAGAAEGAPAADSGAEANGAMAKPGANGNIKPAEPKQSSTPAIKVKLPSAVAPDSPRASLSPHAKPFEPPTVGSPRAASSPKVASKEAQSVAQRKAFLGKKLSGSFADPLQQKKEANGKPVARTKSGISYLADSAKVWGGAPVGAPAPAAATSPGTDPVELKYKPLKDTLPYEELKGLRAEDGIDPARKEEYLSAEEFVKVFGKERADFKAQPMWRQQMAKKKAGLF
ncbi:hypothetical protein N2152v2_009863 [Parachlorella kessleri]